MVKKELLTQVPNCINSVDFSDPHALGILVGVFTILVTLAIFLIWRQRKHARRGVLLMGLRDSGKTSIYSILVHDKLVQTDTSVMEDTGEYVCATGSLKVVDIPGHEGLRTKMFDDYKSLARAIVYVVDSSTFQKEIRDVAELLYAILSDAVVASNCPPLLILCNKQDQTMAKGSDEIKTLLQKEMDVLRTAKTSQLENTDEPADNNIFLGKKDQEFEFDHLNPIKVEFAESSAVKSEANGELQLESLENWLQQVA